MNEDSMPRVESSSLVNKEQDSDEEEEKVQTPEKIQAIGKNKRSKTEIQAEIEDLESQAKQLENDIEEAAAQEEYEKAEEL